VVNLVWRETNFCIDRFKPHENRFKGSRDIEESLWGVFLPPPPKATIKLAKPSATMRVNIVHHLFLVGKHFTEKVLNVEQIRDDKH
jgi:hypothetical protein